MSRDLPALVDPWAMVEGRRGFTGTWPLARLGRLVDLLARPDGEVRFEIQFDRDSIGTAYLALHIQARPWLTCQRTLEAYRDSIDARVRLGLLQSEGEEPSLPPGYEPLVVGDAPLKLIDVVEDELILALPLVPKRDAEGTGGGFSTAEETPAQAQEGDAAHPFAALKGWRRRGD